MHDTMRAVFEVYIEVRVKVYVDDRTLNLQAKKTAEEATEAATNVYRSIVTAPWSFGPASASCG